MAAVSCRTGSHWVADGPPRRARVRGFPHGRRAIVPGAEPHGRAQGRSRCRPCASQPPRAGLGEEPTLLGSQAVVLGRCRQPGSCARA
eukprot:8473724-Lingulodinium_polyedra.AAC.1